MKALSYLNKYLFKYRWSIFWGIVFIIVSNLFAIFPAVYVGKATNDIVTKISDDGALSSKSIWWYFTIIVGATLLNGIFKYFMRQTIIVMSRKVEFDLKNEIFAHYLTLPMSFYQRNKVGDLMNRISEDVGYVRMYLGPGIMYAINLSILLSLVSVQMFRVDVELTLYILIPLPFLAYLIFKISSVINKVSLEVHEKMSGVSVMSQQLMQGVRIIKNFGVENYITKKFEKASLDYRKTNFNLLRVQSVFIPSILLLIGLSSIVIFWIGGEKVINKELSVGVIAEFLIYLNMVVWPVASVGWVSSLVQRAEAAQSRINAFLFEKSDLSSTDEYHKVTGDICFDDVSLEIEGKLIIDRVSFTLKENEAVAMVGQIGSGKTTIANLLLRFLEPSSGQITIGGIDIKRYSIAALRTYFGYVSQEIFLFSDTILENLRVGNYKASTQEIEQVTKQARIYDNIKRFKSGFQTVVGEEGVMLSGGQRQRITIARALLNKPSFLLLDDCLSAVDTDTEKAIINNLKQSSTIKSSLVITHRASITKKVDKVLVIDQGKVIESGTFEELVKQRGAFYDIVKLSD